MSDHEDANLATIQALAREERYARAIDRLFDIVDGAVDRQDFAGLDALVLAAQPRDLTLKVTLALLTITRPLADKLGGRAQFYEKARAFVHALGDDEADRLVERLR